MNKDSIGTYQKINISPTKRLENDLIKIWQAVLGTDKINIDDNFFDFNKSKLIAQKLIKKINDKFKVDIKFSYFLEKELTISNLMSVLEDICLQKRIFQKKGKGKIKKVKSKPYYSLTSAQKRIWIIYKMQPCSSTYNVGHIKEINEKLDIHVLKNSLQTLISRHESLRTNFNEIEGYPAQIVHNQVKLNFKIIDLSSKEDRYKAVERKRIIKRETTKVFNLKNERLFRTTLIKLRQDKYTLVIVTHHIIVDRWSMGVFYKELAILYNAYLERKPNPLPPLTIQCKDYAEWEESSRHNNELKEQEEHWLKKLSGELPVLDLPIDKSRPPVITYNSCTENIQIDKETTEAIKKMCIETDTTLFMFLFTVYNVFLYKITGQTDLIVGILVANRQYYELENVIACIFNNLAIRNNLSNNPQFIDLLKGIKQNILECINNQDYSFDYLIDKLNPLRDLSRPPVFNTVFQLYEKQEREKRLGLSHLGLGHERVFNEVKTGFDVCAEERSDNIMFRFTYNTDLFNRKTIKRLLSNFKTLLGNIITNPNLHISDFEIISQSEKHTLLHTFNKTKVDYPKNKTIHQLFEEQVKKAPHNIAVMFEDQKLIYKELNKKANQLAWVLRKRGIKKDDIVGILMDRSCHTVIAILGILKAGAAYVPIDSSNPEKRIEYIIKDAKSPLIITTDNFKNKLKWFKGNILCVDIKLSKIKNKEKDNPKRKDMKSTSTACIIYTSGSTGKPKGTILHHKGIINHVYTKIKVLKITKNDIICQNSSFGFAASIWQYFTPLIRGSIMIIYPDEVTKEPLKLFKKIDADKVTLIEVIPSLLRLFLESNIPNNVLPKLRTLKYLLVGGEKVSSELINFFYQKYNNPFVVTYGQSEYSDESLRCYIPYNKNTKIVPIGTPSHNTQVYILDKNQNLLPINTIGEIYISGDGLARGYLNQPEKTKQVFLPHPFIKGRRIYKTGDLGRMLPDGNIEYIGRIDHQVKIRGNRVELGEIEANIKKYQNINNVVVITKKEQKKQDKYLVAYYTTKTKNPVSLLKLKDRLKSILPGFMIPACFVHLTKLPLTTSGKISRQSLPEPAEKDFQKTKYQPPQTETEMKLAKIWQEVLNVKKIGLNDNFFNLGGHSLKAIRVLARINKQFKIDLPLKNLFQYPISYELAHSIDQQKKTITTQIKPVSVKPYYKLSIEQKRIWYAQKNKMQTGYHAPFILNLSGKLNTQAIEKSIQLIIVRHEIFRTYFKVIKSIKTQIKLVQLVKDSAKINLPIINLSNKLENQKKILINKIIKNETEKLFNLENDILIRAKLINIGGNEYKLVLKTHSIIFDQWSINLFWRELFSFYRNYDRGINLEKLKPLSINYKDYAEWQNSEQFRRMADRQYKFWSQKLSGGTSILDLPYDKHPKILPNIGRVELAFTFLDGEIARSISHLCSKHNITFFVFFCAIFSIFLNKITNHSDIIIDSFMSNRIFPELDDMIGPIYNHMPIRRKIKESQPFLDFLLETGESILNFQSNNFFYDFNLIENLNNSRRSPEGPLFNVLFSVNKSRTDSKAKRSSDTNLRISRDINSYRNYKSSHDLSFKVVCGKDRFNLVFVYKKSLFNRKTINTFFIQIQDMIKQIINKNEIKIGEIK